MSRRVLVLVVLAGLALLTTAPGASAAPPAGAGNADRAAAVGPVLSSGLLQLPRAAPVSYQLSASGDSDRLAGPSRAGSYILVNTVLPRDGDSSGQPPSHDDAWVPLVILVGLLLMSGAGYLLHARREAA
ncbi:hypothetical protein [Amycolatopsis sp. PS_44_ISF1]|uniref:hypothetical protein n=1 Tax=Amycolatopsis sp. PS_44_ISF1 TaxID=2974917 RepID=UPI0028DE65D5|nr:hypothetical protein [Amycolatopsis sp. PS_44_ISF1]MDT8911549.1 hypothetical protein [Amycolatopsis sp. PS_44_ISF1]